MATWTSYLGSPPGRKIWDLAVPTGKHPFNQPPPGLIVHITPKKMGIPYSIISHWYFMGHCTTIVVSYRGLLHGDTKSVTHGSGSKVQWWSLEEWPSSCRWNTSYLSWKKVNEVRPWNMKIYENVTGYLGLFLMVLMYVYVIFQYRHDLFFCYRFDIWMVPIGMV